MNKKEFQSHVKNLGFDKCTGSMWTGFVAQIVLPRERGDLPQIDHHVSRLLRGLRSGKITTIKYNDRVYEPRATLTIHFWVRHNLTNARDKAMERPENWDKWGEEYEFESKW